jgi:predicted acetyltransferase
VHVDELIGATPAGEARLWAHCIGMDLLNAVRAGTRGPDDSLPWLLSDGRAAMQKERNDHVWARVLDVPAALAARGYLVEGRVVLEVRDPLGFADGRFALEGGPGGAACATTGQTPDLSLPVDVLGSVWLGGVPLSVPAAAGLVAEHRAGALATADAMFRSRPAPWCATWF